MFKEIKNKVLILVAVFALTSCHEIEQWNDDPKGNFDALWTILDEHYCFFEEKGIDWNAVYEEYSKKVSNNMSDEALFLVCSDMLAELKDGHTNLSAPFATSYYRQWWSDYPQNYDERVIQQYYFNYNFIYRYFKIIISISFLFIKKEEE